MRLVTISVLILAQLAANAAAQDKRRESQTNPPTELAALDWLVGHWRSEQDGRVSEEFWTTAEGGVMLGVNRSFQVGEGAAFENLRIARGQDRITYHASPGGGESTTFVLKTLEPNQAVFENLAHDFPQQITYQRNGNELNARIDGKIGDKDRTMQWQWQRVATSATHNKQPEEQVAMQGLRTVVYRVDNLEKAKAWYAKAFDIKPYFDEPFYVGFKVGGYELGLDPDMDGVTRGNNQAAYWGVDDCQAAVSRLIELGATPDSDPEDVGGGIVVATVRDPFGNVLGVIKNPHFKLP